MSLKAVDEKDDKKDKPLGSQSLFRGLQLIEILSNFPTDAHWRICPSWPA